MLSGCRMVHDTPGLYLGTLLERSIDYTVKCEDPKT
jgi:hypothetical protein